MRQQFQRWLDQITVTDPLERRQALIFQQLLLGWIILGTINFFNLAIARMSRPGYIATLTQPRPLILLLSELLLWFCPIIALMIARRGQFRRSVTVAVFGFLIAHGTSTLIVGTVGGATYLLYQLPILLAGLLGMRRLLWAAAISIAIGILTFNLNLTPIAAPTAAPAAVTPSQPSTQQPSAPTTGANLNAAPLQNSISPIFLSFFVGITLLTSFCLDQFGNALQNALITMREREGELESIRNSLEATVHNQTAQLRMALAEAQQRSTQQAQLLAEIEQQRSIILDLSVPVIPIDDSTLVMPLIGSLDSDRLRQIQEHGLQAIKQQRAKTLVLDITGVPIVDSQVAQGLLTTVRSARLLGTVVMLVGIRPEVAQALVGLGIDLNEVRTYSSLQLALKRASTNHILAATP